MHRGITDFRHFFVEGILTEESDSEFFRCFFYLIMLERENLKIGLFKGFFKEDQIGSLIQKQVIFKVTLN